MCYPSSPLQSPDWQLSFNNTAVPGTWLEATRDVKACQLAAAAGNKTTACQTKTASYVGVVANYIRQSCVQQPVTTDLFVNGTTYATLAPYARLQTLGSGFK
jgi:hypothetical protein